MNSTIQSNPDFEKSIEELRQAPTVKPLTQSTTFKGNVASGGIVVILISLLSAPGAAEMLQELDPRLTLFLPLLLNAWNTYQRTKTTSGVAVTRKKADAINERVEIEVKEAARKAAVGVQDTSVPFGGHAGTDPLPESGNKTAELTYEDIPPPKAAIHKAPTEPLKEPAKKESPNKRRPKKKKKSDE